MSFIIVKRDAKMKLTLLTTAALLGIAVSPALAGNLDEPFVPQSPIPMAPPHYGQNGRRLDRFL